MQSGKQVPVNKGDWDKSHGFAADNDFNRRFLGIEKETEFLEMSKRRREEIENPKVRLDYKSRIEKSTTCHSETNRPRNKFGVTVPVRESEPYFGADLPF